MQTEIFKNFTCQKFILGLLETNSYLLYSEDTGKALLIDPAAPSKELAALIKEKSIQPDIYLTHAHADHIAGLEFFCNLLPDSTVYIAKADEQMLGDPILNLSSFIFDKPLTFIPKNLQTIKEGDKLTIFNECPYFTLLPGHTQGGSALVFEEAVFIGDSLFAGSIGRTDHPGGNLNMLLNSLKERILVLDNRKVFSGHGPSTSIKKERENNPFFF